MRANVNVVAAWSSTVILIGAAPAAAQAPSVAGAANAQKAETYGRLPLSFEPNQGQTSPEVKFLARGPGYGLFFTRTEMVLVLRESRAGSAEEAPNRKGSVLRMKLIGANPKAQVVGEKKLPGKSNYFLGKDSAKWRTNIPQFAGVRYRSVYPGVDLSYYGNQRQLEYDFVVAPGADPRAIRLRFSGASSVKIGPSGDLVLAASGGEVTVRAPLIHQDTNGSRQPVAGRFVLRGGREVGFDIGRYDPGKTLIIDPTVVYSTYLGGSDVENAQGAVDEAGNVYLAGFTYSPDFPVTGRLSEASGPTQGFVAKLSADGQSLLYSTVVSPGILFRAIAVDRLGFAYLAGSAYSQDVPVVNAVQPTCPTAPSYPPCFGPYLLKLSPQGDSVIYSTFLGGSRDQLNSIATDSNGNTYLAGARSEPYFPLVNELQTCSGSSDAVAVKLDAQGGWVYSTCLGGGSADQANGVAADGDGNAYVIGRTSSTDFPTANPAQPAHAPNDASYDAEYDGFIAKLSPEGSALVYSTYLGGSGKETLQNVVVNAVGIAWVAGNSWSSDFPTSPGRPSPSTELCGYPYANCSILVKLNAGGQFVYSTVVHLSGALAVDSAENVYVAGSPWVFVWPLVNPLMASTTAYPHHFNVVIEKLDPTATTVMFSTFWGGTGECLMPISPLRPGRNWPCGPGHDLLNFLGVDGAGNIYAVGHTTNDDFPTLDAFQPVPGGTWVEYPDCGTIDECHVNLENSDIFVVKVAQEDNTPTGQHVSVAPADGATITFDGVSSPGTTSFTKSIPLDPAHPPPADLRLGDPPVYYEISTTASYTGGINICLDYSKITFSVEWGLALYHYESGTWVDITTSVDSGNNRICGMTTSLSPFAIFGAPLPPVDVVGLAPPLAPLVPEGSPVAWPDKAFKLGRTLPLRLQLLIQGVPLTDQQVKAPMIAQLSRVGESPLDLDTMDLDAGEANDDSLTFRFSDGSWVYNLGTQGLSAGSYIITIRLWDGRRFQGGFVVKN